MSYLTIDELQAIGFKSLGKNIRISKHASIYRADRISVGDNTRIDDFCVLSAGDGGIKIGQNVHIAVMTTLIGKGSIEVGDFANFSSRVSIYASSDDYSGSFLTNPTVPPEFTNVDHRPVKIGRHCIIGTGSVVLPGTVMEDGAALGALSLANGVLSEFTIYGGIPAKAIKPRSKKLLELESKYLDKSSSN